MGSSLAHGVGLVRPGGWAAAGIRHHRSGTGRPLPQRPQGARRQL